MLTVTMLINGSGCNGSREKAKIRSHEIASTKENGAMLYHNLEKFQISTKK
jgi:hypothetical protein